MRVAALILAAGEGTRLGAALPKAFVTLAGRTLLDRSIETLCAAAVVDLIVPVLSASRIADWTPRERGAKLAAAVSGGARRQDSVAAGLDALPDDIEVVAVHDAARCLVSQSEVTAVVQSAQVNGAAILARPSADTVKLVENGAITSSPERDRCWAAQTPQVFRVDLLRAGLEKALAEGFTASDDAQLVERLGVRVQVVEGSASNIKITHPIDLAIAEALIERGLQSAGPEGDLGDAGDEGGAP